MQKIKFLLLAASLLSYFSIQGIETLIEGKIAYFRQTSRTFREVYSEGPIYGIEVSVQTYQRLYSYVSGSAFYKSGRTLDAGTRTHLLMVPIGAGLKLINPVYKDWLKWYIGGGVLPTYFNIEDKSPFLIPKTIGWGFGGQLKWGFLFYLKHGIFIDIFGDYIILKKKFDKDPDILVDRQRADFSALSIGGALGYRF